MISILRLRDSINYSSKISFESFRWYKYQHSVISLGNDAIILKALAFMLSFKNKNIHYKVPLRIQNQELYG